MAWETFPVPFRDFRNAIYRRTTRLFVNLWCTLCLSHKVCVVTLWLCGITSDFKRSHRIHLNITPKCSFSCLYSKPSIYQPSANQHTPGKKNQIAHNLIKIIPKLLRTLVLTRFNTKWFLALELLGEKKRVPLAPAYQIWGRNSAAVTPRRDNCKCQSFLAPKSAKFGKIAQNFQEILDF